MQPATQTNQARGVALGFTGGLVISFDVPMIRLADSDPWVAMGLRGFCIALVFGLTIAKVQQGSQMQGFDHTYRIEMDPDARIPGANR